MDKQQTLEYLRTHDVSYELTEHVAVCNMAELDSVDLPYPDADAKNLFVCDDKKRNYHLITVRGDKRVDLKELRKQNGLRPLRFASEDDLMERLGLISGAVTPLGLLNDETCEVELFIDEDFVGQLIGVHPNDNTATVWLQTDDLIRIVREHGSQVHVVSV